MENETAPNVRIEELRRLRTLMGTLPESKPPFETRFYRGVEGITVDLLDGSANPYRAMYCMATSTWGTGVWSTGHPGSTAISAIRSRWEDASPEARFSVVNSVLARQALPLALEAPQFTFAIENLSRWAFDQLARARLGVVFSSMGTRDNCHLDGAFRLHESTWTNDLRRVALIDVATSSKKRYRDIVEEGAGNWQEARTVLPISIVHRCCMAINYAALSNLVARRASFSEAEDVVAVAWLLRDRLSRESDGFPLLAKWLRPACDFSKACNYHKSHTMSEAFGCLFKSCGRNPVKSRPGAPSEAYEYADFNESCSDRETISRQVGIKIPEAGDEMPSADDTPETLGIRDRYLFGFNSRNSIDEDFYYIWRKTAPGDDRTPSGRYVEPVDVDQALAG